MKIHLLRHCKTERQSISGRDFDRKLNEKGIKQGELLNEYLTQFDFSSTKLLCSSAMRTKETLDLISPKNSFQSVNYFDDLYLCPHSTFLEKIWKEKDTTDLFFVGHNYGISDIANYFLDSDIELRTGGFLTIRFDIKEWMESSFGMGVMLERYRPEVRM